MSGDGPSSVAVLIPSWNGRAHLETCLAALAEQEDPGIPWEVIVLDNGSDDGTAEWLDDRSAAGGEEASRVRCLRSDVNLGFARGVNRLVRDTDAEAVALLNNDTRPRTSWLATLVEALAAAPTDVAAVSGRLVDWEGSRLDFGRGIMTFDAHAFQLDFGVPLESARVPTAGEELLFACGGNALFWRHRFLEVGGFDDSYFAYFEDVDLGWRLWAEGHRVLAAPDAVAHHRSMATSDLFGHFDRGLLFERNAFTTAYKNFDDAHWQALMPAVLLTLLARTQYLLEANPGGELLRLDPYAGLIAGTGAGQPSRRLLDRLRRHGLGGSVRRVLREVGRRLAGIEGSAPTVTDPRTLAQLRAVSHLIGGLDRAAEKRHHLQSRRRRPDREIFARFPLYVVPTYPGDEELFGRPGFRAWLPDEVPLVESRLEEIVATDS